MAKKPTFEIVAGRNAPCELIKNKVGGGLVIAEGTFTYCNRILEAINNPEGKSK